MSVKSIPILSIEIEEQYPTWWVAQKTNLSIYFLPTKAKTETLPILPPRAKVLPTIF